MKRHSFARLIAVSALLLSSVFTTGSVYPPSPFVGVWRAIDQQDGSLIRVTILGPASGPFLVTWTESFFTFCEGRDGLALGAGKLDPRDPLLLKAEMRLRCFRTGESLQWHQEWEYRPEYDVLASQGDYGVETIWTRFGQPLVPRLDLRVNYGHDWVESFYEEGHSISVRVTESDQATTKATAEVETAPRQEWGGEPGFNTLDFDWDPGQPDIVPGDWVFAQADNGQKAKVQIGEITGEIDLDGDAISGTIAATWFTDEVNVECFPWGAPEPQPEMKFDSALPDGQDEYACAWSGAWDVQTGQDVGVGYFGPDGHWVANAFFVPTPAFVAYLPGAIEGYDWPMGDEITVDINDREYTDTAVSEQRPGFPEGSTRVLFELGPHGYSVQAGDHIVMSDEASAMSKELVVADLAVTDINVEAGTVVGTCSPPCDLWVWLYDQEGQAPEVDENTWVATFDELPSGAWGGATQWDEDGDGTSLDFQVPVVISPSTTGDGIADDGLCTLREAIIAVNTNQPSGEAEGECPAGTDNWEDTIILAAGEVYSLDMESSQEDGGADGDLDIWDNSASDDLVLLVEGDGHATISQDAEPDDRVVDVLGATVHIRDVTLTGGDGVGNGGAVRNTGNLFLSSTIISGNSSDDGGGLANLGGSVTLGESTVADNQAAWGGGISTWGGALTIDASQVTGNTSGNDAGGVYIRDGATVAIRNDSLISDNAAAWAGGISSWASTLRVDASTISTNTATNSAGGVLNKDGGTTEILNGSVISGNAATYEGGVSNWDGSVLTIVGSLVSHNTASSSSGGIGNLGIAELNASTVTGNEAPWGAGLGNGGTMVVDTSTITENSASGGGAGILIWDGSLTVTGSALAGNNAGGDGDAIYSATDIDNGTRITASCIVGNGDIAVYNATSTIQIATGNWWGESSGPTHLSNPGGAGDSVGDNFDFSGWLSAQPACGSS